MQAPWQVSMPRPWNAAAKPEAPEAATVETATVETPKPIVKANPPQKPATKNGK
jgi:hypothetical protein